MEENIKDFARFAKVMDFDGAPEVRTMYMVEKGGTEWAEVVAMVSGGTVRMYSWARHSMVTIMGWHIPHEGARFFASEEEARVVADENYTELLKLAAETKESVRRLEAACIDREEFLPGYLADILSGRPSRRESDMRYLVRRLVDLIKKGTIGAGKVLVRRDAVRAVTWQKDSCVLTVDGIGEVKVTDRLEMNIVRMLFGEPNKPKPENAEGEESENDENEEEEEDKDNGLPF